MNDMLDLESRLTIAHRRDCECGPYFVERRHVLIPEVRKEADRRGVDPLDLFALYAKSVHARHLSGLSLAVSA